jgi:hypothetical protein
VAERKVKVQNPTTGQTTDGFEVPVEESNERWSEFKLEDGTTLKAKMTLINIVRVPDAFDQMGNPMYVINATPTFAIVDVSEKLRRKVQ